MIQTYRRFLSLYLSPHRGRVVGLAVLLVTGAGLQLANPQIVRGFIDATQTGVGHNAVLAGLAFIGVALAHNSLQLASGYLGKDIGWRATNALRADLTRHLLRLDMSFHKTHTPGELIERVDGDVTTLANFFSEMIIAILWNSLLILGILTLLYREDWRIGLGLTVYAVLTVLALGALQDVGSGRWARARQANAELAAFVEERITGTEDIRGNGGEAYVLRRLYPLMRGVLDSERPAQMLGQLTYVATRFLFVLGYAIGLGLGAYLYTQGAVSLGAAYLIVIYIGMLSTPLENIRAQAQDFQRATAGIERVQALLALQPAVQEQPRATLPSGPLAVGFDRVSFIYDDKSGQGQPLAPVGLPNPTAPGGGPPPGALLPSSMSSNGHSYVIRDLSFQLHPGQTLGLLGRTGSGKTTLTRLLFRLYDPTRGVIRLGETAIDTVALGDLRQRVGMVTQDVQLFQASIRDNLTFFNRQISDTQLHHALRELDLWDWARALPQGLDTRLGAGGLGLSAGEAQLLAFARVFLKDPGLVILDEASSRLDPVTERRLEQATARLLNNRTGIIIAHRLQTIQRVDQIMILEAGQVVEAGPRVVLATQSTSRFYHLLQTGLEEALA